jgi:hypothetical protein
LFENPQDSIEYTNFIKNKNLNKKLKELQTKLNNEHYSFMDFKNLIANNLEFIPEGNDVKNITTLLDIEIKNRELLGKKVYIRPIPKSIRVTKTNLRYSFPKRQERFLDKVLQRISIEGDEHLDNYSQKIDYLYNHLKNDIQISIYLKQYMR